MGIHSGPRRGSRSELSARDEMLPAFLPTCPVSCSSERYNVTVTESILFIHRYIYVIYIKYIEIIIYIYYTLSYNIYITHLWTRKISGDFINGTVLLEKRFNFHIPIRWHLVSQLVGEGLKMVGRAVPRALTFGHSPESGAFSLAGLSRGPAGPAGGGGLSPWAERVGDLTWSSCCPRGAVSPVCRERMANDAPY